MTPFEAGERGWRDRVVNDPTFAALLPAASVQPGWPTDTMTEADFPRMTYFIVNETVRRPGFGTVLLQTDLWFWRPDGSSSRPSAFFDIDERHLELIDEQIWTFSNFRLYATVERGRDHPVPAGEPLRLQRDLRIQVSPA